MLPTLTTRAGSSSVPAASSSGRKARVRKNGALRFRSSTLSQAEAGNSANGVPQVARALVTRTCTRCSLRPTSAATRRHASLEDRAARTEITRSWAAGAADADRAPPALLLGEQVGRYRNHPAMGGELGDGGVPGLGLAGAEVHRRAGLQQPAGHHSADPAGATGDHGHVAGQVEQVHAG